MCGTFIPPSGIRRLIYLESILSMFPLYFCTLFLFTFSLPPKCRPGHRENCRPSLTNLFCRPPQNLPPWARTPGAPSVNPGLHASLQCCIQFRGVARVGQEQGRGWHLPSPGYCSALNNKFTYRYENCMYFLSFFFLFFGNLE